MTSSIKKASLILAIPTIELLCLRWFLHGFLNLRIGFNWVTDSDFFFPVPIAFCIFVYLLEDYRPRPLTWQNKSLVLNIISLGLFLFLNIFYHSLGGWESISFYWRTFLFIIIGTSFCCLVPLSYYLKNPQRLAILPALVIAGAVSIQMNIFNFSWIAFGKLLTPTLASLATILLGNTDIFVSRHGMITILHPELVLRIGKGCSGIDAFLFFSMAFLISLMRKGHVLSNGKWLIAYGTGIILMHFLNAFRILLLFALGVILQRYLGKETGLRLLKLVFHVHLGWVLYSLGIGAYMFVLYHLKFFAASKKAPLREVPMVPFKIPAGQEP